MYRFLIIIFSLFLFCDSLYAQSLKNSDTSRSTLKEEKKKKDWFVVITPSVGVFKNILRFSYDVPTGPDQTTTQTKELVDTGWGGGLVTNLIWGRFSLANVFFMVPEVNSSRVIGSTLYASYRHPLTPWLDIFGGLGFVYNQIDGHYKNFEDEVTANGVTAKAVMKDIYVVDDVYVPFPRLGLRFNLPIQHWYIAPWVSYMYETFHISLNSTGGVAYIPEPVNATRELPPIEANRWKSYHSPLIGVDLRIDYHYALQLRTRIHYDLNHDKLNIRLTAFAFFSRNIPVGVVTHFTYAEGVVHDNIYVFLGPSYMF